VCLNLAFSPGLDKSLGASCKDSIGWMFSKLDTSADLFLDQTELAAINLDKYEVCIRPFFNSCDTYKDGRVSTAEWCFCFWREKPPCLVELERIQIQEASKKKPGEGARWAGLGGGRGGVPQGPPEAWRLQSLGIMEDAEPRGGCGLGRQERELPSRSYPHGGTGSPKQPLNKCILSTHFVSIHSGSGGWDNRRFLEPSIQFTSVGMYVQNSGESPL